MEDRRIFSRFVAKLTVKFLDLARNKEGLVETHDISAKGLGLVTSEELAAHTPLELWVVVPDKGEPLYTRGEVAWSEQVGTHKFKAGVNLEKADLMGMSRVLRTI